MSARPPTIHVVDDDDSFRRAVSRLLAAAGFAVAAHASAAEFLLARPGEEPGCVLLDVEMPGLGGLDLQAALAKQGLPLPIVFVTAHGDIPMAVQAVKTGAVDFLTKPVKQAALLQAVRTALARDAAQRRRIGHVEPRHERSQAGSGLQREPGRLRRPGKERFGEGFPVGPPRVAGRGGIPTDKQ